MTELRNSLQSCVNLGMLEGAGGGTRLGLDCFKSERTQVRGAEAIQSQYAAAAGGEYTRRVRVPATRHGLPTHSPLLLS